MAKRKKKAPYAKKGATQSMSMSNPYVNTPVQSNNQPFNFPGAVL